MIRIYSHKHCVTDVTFSLAETRSKGQSNSYHSTRPQSSTPHSGELRVNFYAIFCLNYPY